MTQLDYAKKLLEMAEKMVKNSVNETEENQKIVKEFYDLCKEDVEQCSARPDLFDTDYDNLEEYYMYTFTGELTQR